MKRGGRQSSFLFMERSEKKIEEIVERILKKDEALFLVNVKVKGAIGNQKVLIFIDSDRGLNIDDCSKVSRLIGKQMETEDFMLGKYLLEVSSPGLDYPIVMKRQYKRHVGRFIEVETHEGRKMKAKLNHVSEDELILQHDDQDKPLRFKDIKQSKILISFK